MFLDGMANALGATVNNTNVSESALHVAYLRVSYERHRLARGCLQSVIG